MKFNAKTFVRQADAAFTVAKESTLIPIFEYVLIAPSEGGVTITASNYSHSVRCFVECTESPLKAFCLHSTGIWPVLKTLDGEVEITMEGKWANMCCGGVSLDVPALDHKEFQSIVKGEGKALMEVEIEGFLKAVSDLSYFLETDDGLKPGRQNVLVGPKGCYGFDSAAGATCALYNSTDPFILPPAVRGVMSKFAGKWKVFAGPGWVRFQQGEQFYRRNCPEFKAEEAISVCHNVLLNAANSESMASFEVARIAPSIARAVLVGAYAVDIQGSDKISIMCKGINGSVVLEESLPSDGTKFKTTMQAKLLHGCLDIVGYGGVIEVKPNVDWDPSFLVKNTEKKFMAIIGAYKV